MESELMKETVLKEAFLISVLINRSLFPGLVLDIFLPLCNKLKARTNPGAIAASEALLL